MLVIAQDKYKTIGLPFDSSGASNSTFIQKKAINLDVPQKLKNFNLKITGRYSFATINQESSFTIKLPDFDSSKSVQVTALVEIVGCASYDMVLVEIGCASYDMV